MAMVSAGGSSQSFGGLTAQIDWFGLRVGGHPALSLHSSNEPGELSQWLCHDDSTINIVVVIIIIIIIIPLADERGLADEIVRSLDNACHTWTPYMCVHDDALYTNSRLPFPYLSMKKMIGEGCPLPPEILDQTDRVGAKSPIFDLFSLIATQP